MQKTALPKTALTAKAIAITAEIEMTLNCIRSILAVEGHFCSLLISNIIWLSSLSFICLSLRNCFPFHLYNSRQVRSTFVSLRKLVPFPSFSHFSLPLCQNHIKTFCRIRIDGLVLLRLSSTETLGFLKVYLYIGLYLPFCDLSIAYYFHVCKMVICTNLLNCFYLLQRKCATRRIRY